MESGYANAPDAFESGMESGNVNTPYTLPGAEPVCVLDLSGSFNNAIGPGNPMKRREFMLKLYKELIMRFGTLDAKNASEAWAGGLMTVGFNRKRIYFGDGNPITFEEKHTVKSKFAKGDPHSGMAIKDRIVMECDLGECTIVTPAMELVREIYIDEYEDEDVKPPHLVMLITDGQFNDRDKFIAQMADAKYADMYLVIVIIGMDVHHDAIVKDYVGLQTRFPERIRLVDNGADTNVEYLVDEMLRMAGVASRDVQQVQDNAFGGWSAMYKNK